MPEVGRSLGSHLGQKSAVRIVVCSAHPSSADAAVVEGFARTSADIPGNVIVHHPLDDRPGLKPGESIAEQWKTLIARTGLARPQMRQNSEARVLDNSGLSNAFLLCQIRALREDTDVVVALGGRRDASTAQLLAIARGSFRLFHSLPWRRGRAGVSAPRGIDSILLQARHQG
jgi:hypothetical protein